MANIEYIEDALEEVLLQSLFGDLVIEWQDHTILTSLSASIQKNQALTQKQSRLLLKILSKYQNFKNNQLILSDILADPKWRFDFRKLDLSKTIFLEKDDEGILWFVMRFPYNLLKDFENSIVTDLNRSRIQFEAERKVRKLKFYDFNIMAIDGFVKKHNFIIDDTFIEALNQVEEIWQQYENIVQYSEILDGRVCIKNASDDAQIYFQEHQKNSLFEDMFLAKQMNYPLRLTAQPTTVLEKIVSENSNHFWVKNNSQFFELHKNLNGVSAIIIDRNTKDLIKWLDQFVSDADASMISRRDIRVCFREPKDSNIPLNSWIKNEELRGPVDGGRIFIFKHKPAKWIFSNNIDVKIVATNSFIPPSEYSVKAWVEWHPCVLFISDIEPTELRNKKIVNL